MAGVAPILAIVLIVPLALLAWRLLSAGVGLGGDFVIRYRKTGEITVRGRIPRAKIGTIREFCRQDLDATGAFTIRGWWGPNRLLRLRCTGRLSPGQRQQVRNFLAQCLR